MQPVPSYNPGGGLNAIQEDSEMEEKESHSRQLSDGSGDKIIAVPQYNPNGPDSQSLSNDDVAILSELSYVSSTKSITILE